MPSPPSLATNALGIAAVLGVLAACGDSSVKLGQGVPADARFVADLYTWECNTGESYEGVFAYDVSLEYAPDALADRKLPESGCTAEAELFPEDAGAGGLDLPDATQPRWSNGELAGDIPRRAAGFYKQSVFAEQRTCQDAQDLLGEGTMLADAGDLSGALTPAPGEYDGVTLSGDFDDATGIPFGATLQVEWEATHWDASWIQVRRELGGSVVQAVTCNTEGASAFTVDETVWSLLSDAIDVDVTNLYVGVENRDEMETPDGELVEVTTRAMHVAVVSGD